MRYVRSEMDAFGQIDKQGRQTDGIHGYKQQHKTKPERFHWNTSPADNDATIVFSQKREKYPAVTSSGFVWNNRGMKDAGRRRIPPETSWQRGRSRFPAATAGQGNRRSENGILDEPRIGDMIP